MLIDAHAHLTHPSFEGALPALLERAHQAGVEKIVNICTHPDEVEKGLQLKERYPWIYTVAATTPHDAAKEGEPLFPKMEEYAKRGALVAVGETGLDYHYYSETKEVQCALLRRYLRLAKNCTLPVVIHCRDAFEDLIRIIDEEYSGLPGVLHCFTGSAEEASALLQRGWFISFSGIVTFNKSRELQQIAAKIPLERLMIETDAPYLAPAPYRGKENEPAYLLATAQFLAHLRGIPLEELSAATVSNTRQFFKI